VDFKIRLGVPDVLDFWKDLCERRKKQKLSKSEIIFHNKVGKAFNLLSSNPKHPSLVSHEIKFLSKRYGLKVWESYLENNVPAAGRIFWVYGSSKNEITIIGIEPHPEDRKHGSYERISLSALPKY
jgi:hypothetical protein